MNSNDPTNGLTNQSHDLEIQSHQQSHQQAKKKSHGNRKLQRYRRKLRNRGMAPDAIACLTNAWVDMSSTKINNITQGNLETETSFVKEAISYQTTTVTSAAAAKKHQTNEQRSKNMKKKNNFSRSTHRSKVSSSTTTRIPKNTSETMEKSINYTNIPDQVFCQMLLSAFNGIDKLDRFLNENEKIEFVRNYTDLIDRLSYLKLQQFQWNYYHHIGTIQNIWMGRIPKHLAEKNSICYTYGRSKTRVEHRCKEIREQVQQAQNTIHLFEQQVLLKAAQHVDCSSEIKMLFSTINTFVHEHQQKLQDEFEYKRQMLILDATDHRLFRIFYDLKPKKTQVKLARRIWQATVKQTMIEEDIVILEHRLTSQQSPAATTLLDQMINNIDALITESNDDIHSTTSFSSSALQLKKMNQLKHDIIHHSIITGRKMIENFEQIILDGKQKCCFNKSLDESSSDMQRAIVNAIETRQLHMIKRAKYITTQKLASLFQKN